MPRGRGRGARRRARRRPARPPPAARSPTRNDTATTEIYTLSLHDALRSRWSPYHSDDVTRPVVLVVVVSDLTHAARAPPVEVPGVEVPAVGVRMVGRVRRDVAMHEVVGVDPHDVAR